MDQKENICIRFGMWEEKGQFHVPGPMLVSEPHPRTCITGNMNFDKSADEFL